MREIKFRAFNKTNTKNKWMKVSNIWIGSLNNYVFGEVLVGEMQTWFGGYELMQYIGQKDRNGKEIYEKDLVEYRDKNGLMESGVYEVVYLDFGFGLKPIRGLEVSDELEDKKSFPLCYPGVEVFENLVVIGNVYQNKELMK